MRKHCPKTCGFCSEGEFSEIDLTFRFGFLLFFTLLNKSILLKPVHLLFVSLVLGLTIHLNK